MTNKNSIITYLKALAIILVVFDHCFFYQTTHSAAPIEIASSPWRILELVITTIHVPLFFFLSGYLSHKQPIKDYFLKKVTRILIPFLFFTLAKVLFNVFVSKEFAHGTSVGEEFFAAFVCGELYWFSLAILLMYILAPLLWILQERKHGLFFVGGILLLTISLNVVRDFVNFPLINILQIENFLIYFPFFALGYFVKNNFYRFNLKCNWIAFAIGLSIYITLILLIYFKAVDAYWSILFVLRVSAFVFLWKLFSLASDRILPLQLVGNFSYQVYLLDSFIRVALFWLIYKIGWDSMFSIYVLAPLDILICVLICLIVERIPAVSFVFGLKWKRKKKEETQKA